MAMPGSKPPPENAGGGRVSPDGPAGSASNLGHRDTGTQAQRELGSAYHACCAQRSLGARLAYSSSRRSSRPVKRRPETSRPRTPAPISHDLELNGRVVLTLLVEEHPLALSQTTQMPRHAWLIIIRTDPRDSTVHTKTCLACSRPDTKQPLAHGAVNGRWAYQALPYRQHHNNYSTLERQACTFAISIRPLGDGHATYYSAT